LSDTKDDYNEPTETDLAEHFSSISGIIPNEESKIGKVWTNVSRTSMQSKSTTVPLNQS